MNRLMLALSVTIMLVLVVAVWKTTDGSTLPVTAAGPINGGSAPAGAPSLTASTPSGPPVAPAYVELQRIYSARHWEELVRLPAASERLRRDQLHMLAVTRFLCTREGFTPSTVPALHDTVQERASMAIAHDAASRLCAGFNVELLDAAILPDGLIDHQVPPQSETLPQGFLAALDSTDSPAEYELIAFDAVGSGAVFPADWESDVGLPDLSDERRQNVRLAAAVEARCQLFPGCEPGSFYTIAGCWPDRCVQGQTFSARFMEEHLTLNEQVMATRLARNLAASRGREVKPGGP